MDKLLNNMSVILMKDYIKPLTQNLNSQFNLSLSDEDLISLISKEDVKMAPKKRVTRKPTNLMFQVRDFPECLELVKVDCSNRMYILGKSTVVYTIAQICYEDEESDDTL